MATRLKTKIKKNDTVQVISGKHKDEKGKVLRVNLEKGQVIVEKINFIKRHMRPSSAHRQGGIIEKEGPIQISNVMIVCPKCNVPVKVGKKVLEDGKKVRFCKRCDEILDR
ncbi:MAG: 50S ribosomal protein L24 [Deltaproteobacteria bacterium]|uniref:Large ribosomal subunit protein uL24 n=1 Tax=Candidatus Zymogenus saltonus TaxID=2844893 RepID=A0A9D8KFX0_9DELT|nr:50S ribosomal protein L24 [Candidatus Zymogenus saltonus]